MIDRPSANGNGDKVFVEDEPLFSENRAHAGTRFGLRGPRGYWVVFDDLKDLEKAIQDGTLFTKSEVLAILDSIIAFPENLDKLTSKKYNAIRMAASDLPEKSSIEAA